MKSAMRNKNQKESIKQILDKNNLTNAILCDNLKCRKKSFNMKTNKSQDCRCAFTKKFSDCKTIRELLDCLPTDYNKKTTYYADYTSERNLDDTEYTTAIFYKLTKCNLLHANLCDFTRTNMLLFNGCFDSVDMMNASLSAIYKSTFGFANAEKLKIYGMCEGCTFTRTNLKHSHFELINECTFNETIMCNSKIQTELQKSIFNRVILSGINFTKIDIYSTTFSNCIFMMTGSNANFSDSCFTNTTFIDCNLIGVNFANCEFTKCKFIKCVARKSDFINAKFADMIKPFFIF